MEYEALTISELYRERWNVELFFKWIKQHLHIKSFYGTSENAIYLQIWIAVCTYLLLALTKKKMHMNQSLHTISKNVGLFLTDKPQLMNYLTRLFPRKSQPITICRAYSDRKISKRDSSVQLLLLNFETIFFLSSSFRNLNIV